MCFHLQITHGSPRGRVLNGNSCHSRGRALEQIRAHAGIRPHAFLMHFWGVVAPCAPSKGCKQEKGAAVLMGSQDVEHHEGWILEEDLGWHHPPRRAVPSPAQTSTTAAVLGVALVPPAPEAAASPRHTPVSTKSPKSPSLH